MKRVGVGIFYTWRSFFLSWWKEYFVFGNNDELEIEQSAIKLRNDHRLFQSWNATKVVLFKGFSSNKYKQFTLKARVNYIPWPKIINSTRVHLLFFISVWTYNISYQNNWLGFNIIHRLIGQFFGNIYKEFMHFFP